MTPQTFREAPVRLRAPLAVLWRSPGVLQLGLDPDCALVLDGVPEPLADVAQVLATPHTTTSLDRMFPELDAGWSRWLIEQLAEAGLLDRAAVPVVPPVAVAGAGPLADAVATCLSDSGIGTVSRLRGGDSGVGPEVVVVASRTTEPDRALTEDLFRNDRVHLVVRIEPGAAVVGPLVVPGRTPCVRCHDLHRTRLDAAWPRLLAQLCRQSGDTPPTLTTWAAVTATAQVRAFLGGAIPETAGRSLELSQRDFRLRSRPWPAHPGCGCLLAVA